MNDQNQVECVSQLRILLQNDPRRLKDISLLFGGAVHIWMFNCSALQIRRGLSKGLRSPVSFYDAEYGSKFDLNLSQKTNERFMQRELKLSLKSRKTYPIKQALSLLLATTCQRLKDLNISDQHSPSIVNCVIKLLFQNWHQRTSQFKIIVVSSTLSPSLVRNVGRLLKVMKAASRWCYGAAEIDQMLHNTRQSA